MHTLSQGLETRATGFLEPSKPRFILLILSAIFFIACEGVSEQEREAIQQALADSSDHTSETWGITLELMEDGNRFVHITSPYAVSTETKEESVTVLYGPVYIEVRDADGNPETYVSSSKAIYWSRSSEFYLEGNVIVEAPGNRTLTTEALTWFQFRREIEAEGLVTIVTPADSIVGTGLTGDDRLETYTIGRVSGSFTIEDKENDQPGTGSGS